VKHFVGEAKHFAQNFDPNKFSEKNLIADLDSCVDSDVRNSRAQSINKSRSRHRRVFTTSAVSLVLKVRAFLWLIIWMRSSCHFWDWLSIYVIYNQFFVYNKKTFQNYEGHADGVAHHWHCGVT
jgi:hypothetical protein